MRPRRGLASSRAPSQHTLDSCQMTGTIQPMETLSREFYLTGASEQELDAAAAALRHRPLIQHKLSDADAMLGILAIDAVTDRLAARPNWRVRLTRWLKQNFDGDSQWVDLDVQRQLDALVSAHVMEFGTSRAVGPIMKKRLREFNLRYKALRSGLVR